MERKIVLTPVKISHADITLDSIREKMEKLGITGSDVEDAIK